LFLLSGSREPLYFIPHRSSLNLQTSIYAEENPTSCSSRILEQNSYLNVQGKFLSEIKRETSTGTTIDESTACSNPLLVELQLKKPQYPLNDV